MNHSQDSNEVKMVDLKAISNNLNRVVNSLISQDKDSQTSLERQINYLQSYADQRKKPSDPHGLDIWAHEALGLEKKEYNDEERKFLRELFQKAETDILENAKTQIKQLINTNPGYIKQLLSRPLKDELKISCSEIIAREKLSGFEENIINLYLKGTAGCAQAALSCMRTSKNIMYYFPIKGLKPSRLSLSDEEKGLTIKEFREQHPIITFFENTGDYEILKDYFLRHQTVLESCYILIALPYTRQKVLLSNLKILIPEAHRILGTALEGIYQTLTKPKPDDYAGELKKALANSIMIGGFNVSKKNENVICRNLAGQRDYKYLEYIIDNLDFNYRIKYFSSILNPPKHIKDERGKERLIWVFNQIKINFVDDFKMLESLIRWHLGNEDPDIKIETLLIIANLSDNPGNEIIGELKAYSHNDGFKSYHNRINAILPDESLLFTKATLRRLSEDSLQSKISIILEKQPNEVLISNLKVLFDYLEEINDERFLFVLGETEKIYSAINDSSKRDIDKIIYETLKNILVSDARERDSRRKEILLTYHILLNQIKTDYPASLKAIPDSLQPSILRNIIFSEKEILKAIQLAVTMLTKSEEYLSAITLPLAERIFNEKYNLSNLQEAFSYTERVKTVSCFFNILALLKNQLHFIEKQGETEKEKMKNIIIKEIIPKLEKAQQRAIEQELFLENYNKIKNILQEFANTTLQQSQNNDFKKDSKQPRDLSKVAQDLEQVTPPRLMDILIKIKSLPGHEREIILWNILDSRTKEGIAEDFFKGLKDLPAPLLDWLMYQLLNYAIKKHLFRQHLINDQLYKLYEIKLLQAMNQTLFRLYSNYQNELQQIAKSRENQLKEIGKLIFEYLDRIEINLYGYYELRESLSNIGLEAIIDKPGAIITRDNADVNLFEIIPTKENVNLFQAITTGLQLKNGTVIQKVFLEPKKD